MPASIGVNLRVTGHCRQGGRKYMEDFFSVAYQQTEDERDLEYAFFGIYDGHGGAEAAAFAKEHLMETIIKHKSFWSDNDDDVLRAIKDGYIATHYAMWREQEKWPKTASGLPSTAGTTASVAFIRRGKVYIGHVGDSGIILGYQEEGSTEWKAKPLTRDHKPENFDEIIRINQCGGKVVTKSGVPRVVWNRPKMGHQGPVRRSTPIDEIPFLAVARSLGDLWSYNSQINQFIVSPNPDCYVMKIDTNIHRCLVFGTDGLFNMLSPQASVHIVQQAERHNENAALSDNINKTWLNPSKLLVEKALERWHSTKMRADNTSVVTLMLDPPGPPRAQVLKNRKEQKMVPYPVNGLEIMTRYQNQNEENYNIDDHKYYYQQEQQINNNNNETAETMENFENNYTLTSPTTTTAPPLSFKSNPPITTMSTPLLQSSSSSSSSSSASLLMQPLSAPLTSNEITTNFPLKERNFASKPKENTSLDPKLQMEDGKENLEAMETRNLDHSIQINEISSSSSDECSDDLSLGHNNNNNNNHKHNLRSTKQKININNNNNNNNSINANNNNSNNNNSQNSEIMTRAKRKSVQDDGYQLRKKNKIESVNNNNNNIKNILSKKISTAQKILKTKKINLKKKNLQKTITKKKLLSVITNIKNNNNNNINNNKNNKRKKNLNVTELGVQCRSSLRLKCPKRQIETKTIPKKKLQQQKKLQQRK